MKIPDAELDELELYLHDIADSTPLSREQEVELAARIRAGDMAARDELVHANLLFVITVAKRCQHRGLPLAELISAGNLGLITAAERFDGTKGFKFISYAVWWIRQAIQQALAEESRTIRLPNNQLDTLRKITRIQRSLGIGRIGETELESIAKALAIPPREVREMLLGGRPVVSLDGPGKRPSKGKASDQGGDVQSLLEMVPDEACESPDNSLTREEQQEEVQAAVEHLDGREALILRRYFGLDGEDPMTLDDIGARLGLTRERVRQIKEKALHNLRRPTDALKGLREAGGVTVSGTVPRPPCSRGRSRKTGGASGKSRKSRAKGNGKQSPPLVQR